MTKKEYVKTKDIIDEKFSERLSLHKQTKVIYLDDSIFDLGKFRNEVYKEHGILLDNDKYICELAFLAAEHNAFSPIEDYLIKVSEEHEAINYSEMFRHIAEKALHIDPDSIASRYLAKTLIGSVARIFEPGIKFDQALILYGKQGYFKTSFFEVLAGEDNFTSIHLTNFDKDERMVCQSKWMIELGEVEQSITRRQIGKIKQFLTERSDTLRKPYDRNTVTIPRSFILVGSTNKRDFLVDETGNRRFWIIDLKEKIDLDWVKQNRDLIWAAAVAAYLQNEPIYLNETEQQISNVLNKQYEKEDIWTPIIAEWVSKRKDSFTLGEIANDALGIEVKKQNNFTKYRITQILEQLGLEKPTKTSRENGKSGKFWRVREAIAA